MKKMDDELKKLEKLFALMELLKDVRDVKDKGGIVLSSSLLKHVHEEYRERQPDSYNREMVNVIIKACQEELRDYLLNYLGDKYGGLITTQALTTALIGVEMSHQAAGRTKTVQAINQDLDKALAEMGVEVVWLKD